MINCTLKILTSISIEDREFGRRFLDVLLKHFPNHVPQAYGSNEPVKKRFQQDNVDLALDCWGKQFFLIRRHSPDVLMQASFSQNASRSRHSSIDFIDFQISNEDEIVNFKAMVLELSEVFVADYAMAHILTVNELEDWFERRLERSTSWPAPPAAKIVSNLRKRVSTQGYTKVLWAAECLKLNTLQLRKCLPNLYWLNVFGAPYIEIIGMQKLLNAPAASVEVLPYGGIAIALTGSLSDTVAGWKTYNKVRTECLAHLDSNVFCRAGVAKDHAYKTPDFVFSAGGLAN